MRSLLARAAAVVAGAAAVPFLLAGPASAEQSVYCVFTPPLEAGIGPRPMSTQPRDLCVPWPFGP